MDCTRQLVLTGIIGLSIDMETYVLVPWPESQEYMEEEWFQDEAILALGVEESVGSSAYFIPVHRILFEENQ